MFGSMLVAAVTTAVCITLEASPAPHDTLPFFTPGQARVEPTGFLEEGGDPPYVETWPVIAEAENFTVSAQYRLLAHGS